MDGQLSPEIRMVLEGARAYEKDLPDPFDYPPLIGRALNQVRGKYWNVDLPDMAEIRCTSIPPDPSLGSGRTNVIAFVPPDVGPGAIVYVHGGGWAFSPLTFEEHFARALALASGMTVLAIDYGLAPERPFPGPIDDVIAAWHAICLEPTRFGAIDGPLVLAGDSAGANIALATMLRMQPLDQPMPSVAALIYGVYRYAPASSAMQIYGDIAGPPARHMEAFWNWYVPDPATRINDPLAAPLLASDAQLRDLPPLTLLWAEVDTLADDSLLLSQRLAALGRSDIVMVEPGMVHGFLQMGARLSAARRATRALADAIRHQLSELE